MKENIYFDTSALAKWYLNEPRSEEVEEYIQAHGPVGISDLTVLRLIGLWPLGPSCWGFPWFDLIDSAIHPAHQYRILDRTRVEKGMVTSNHT
jgi:hypothetical protein